MIFPKSFCSGRQVVPKSFCSRCKVFPGSFCSEIVICSCFTLPISIAVLVTSICSRAKTLKMSGLDQAPFPHTIQTSDPDLSKGFDPDFWKDTMCWRVDVWSSDGCMFFGFLLCSYSPCQAAKQQTVAKPRCQAVKLPSCTCRKVTLLSSQGTKSAYSQVEYEV